MEQLPAWNNSAEYRNLGSDDFNADGEKLTALVREIEDLSQTETFDVPRLRKISRMHEQAVTLLSNLQVYVSCEMSLDAKNELAQKWNSRLMQSASALDAVMTASRLFLSRCKDDVLLEYLNSPETQPQSFHWREERKQKDFLLSQEQEQLLSRFRQYGLQSWGDLYNQISGSLTVDIPGRGKIGFAQALGLLREGDEQVRHDAWIAIQDAWKNHENSGAAILNNLAGYRLEEYRRRSHTKPMSFLDKPLIESRIERATLDAMMNAILEAKPVLQRALKAMAKRHAKRQLDPWDLMAPMPRKSGTPVGYSFEEARRMVTGAFTAVEPAMGDFVSMMIEKGWVDSRVLPNKRGGAFCTGFLKSRTPRVFQTFLGSFQDVSTLAHELGHAWHDWTMRDLPLAQLNCPMTLAETASIFAENALSDFLYSNATDESVRQEIAYAEVSDAVSFLANIPTRFEFEKNFYEARERGTLTPNELGDLMENAFKKWYGDGLSRTERQFWMTKLHFSIAGISFYNYPYTFGYLFSLGVYAQRSLKGDQFGQIYRDILRDTGRMTAEELIQSHLGIDIRTPELWRQSLKLVEQKVQRLEEINSRAATATGHTSEGRGGELTP